MYTMTEEPMMLSRKNEKEPLYLEMSAPKETTAKFKEQQAQYNIKPATEYSYQAPPAAYVAESPGVYVEEQPASPGVYLEETVATATGELIVPAPGQPAPQVAPMTYDESSQLRPYTDAAYDAWIASPRPVAIPVSCPNVRPVSVITELRYDADPDSFDAYPVIHPQLTRFCPTLPVHVACLCK